MRNLVEVGVRYYEYEFTNKEYTRFVELKAAFNQKEYEGEHDPADAVRVVRRDVGIAHMFPVPDVTAFVVKHHLAEDWDDNFHSMMAMDR